MKVSRQHCSRMSSSRCWMVEEASLHNENIRLWDSAKYSSEKFQQRGTFKAKFFENAASWVGIVDKLRENSSRIERSRAFLVLPDKHRHGIFPRIALSFLVSSTRAQASDPNGKSTAPSHNIRSNLLLLRFVDNGRENGCSSLVVSSEKHEQPK